MRSATNPTNKLGRACGLHRREHDSLTDQRIQGLTHAFMARGMSAIDAQHAALKALDAQVMQQAAMLSFNDSWLFILLVFTLVSPAILLLRRGRSARAVEVEAH